MAKRTKYYNSHWLTAKSVWFLPNPPPLRFYPGAVIPVDDIDEFFCIDADGVQTIRPLPPGVPLNVDIFDAILKHIWWYKTEETYAVCQIVESTLEKLYMEALWRQIKKKKEQACSVT